VTPLRRARATAIPTNEELAARRGRARGAAGITQPELAQRLRVLGRKATSADVCRWEKRPDEIGAIRPSHATKALLEQALGLAPGTFSLPLCPTCGGTGLAA